MIDLICETTEQNKPQPKFLFSFSVKNYSIRDFLYVEVFGDPEERSWSTIESTSNYVIV